MIRTEPMDRTDEDPNNAVEFEDYLPIHELIEFEKGGDSKTVSITIL